jgi:hypothetical protein
MKRDTSWEYNIAHTFFVTGSDTVLTSLFSSLRMDLVATPVVALLKCFGTRRRKRRPGLKRGMMEQEGRIKLGSMLFYNGWASTYHCRHASGARWPCVCGRSENTHSEREIPKLDVGAGGKPCEFPWGWWVSGTRTCQVNNSFLCHRRSCVISALYNTRMVIL